MSAALEGQGPLETVKTTEESIHNFVGEALAQDPEAKAGHIAARWRSRRGEVIGAEEEGLLAREYERQAPAAHEANAGVRAAQARRDSPPFGVIWQEIAGLVAGLVPFLLTVETINVIRRDGAVTSGSYFSLGGALGGAVAIALAVAVFRFAIRGGSVASVKAAHAGLGALILLLGVYHLLHGFGILHSLGIYRF